MEDKVNHALLSMRRAKSDAEARVRLYERGLFMAEGLVEGQLYEINFLNDIVLLAQLKEIGRDRALFTPYTCSVSKDIFQARSFSLTKNQYISLSWAQNWEHNPPQDLALYIGYPWITRDFEKLLKEKPCQDSTADPSASTTNAGPKPISS